MDRYKASLMRQSDQAIAVVSWRPDVEHHHGHVPLQYPLPVLEPQLQGYNSIDQVVLDEFFYLSLY